MRSCCDNFKRNIHRMTNLENQRSHPMSFPHYSKRIEMQARLEPEVINIHSSKTISVSVVPPTLLCLCASVLFHTLPIKRLRCRHARRLNMTKPQIVQRTFERLKKYVKYSSDDFPFSIKGVIR